MESQILKKIENLPIVLQQEVNDFVDFLIYKSKQKQESTKNKKSNFGILKGKIKMSKDFDEPMEDFKEYM